MWNMFVRVLYKVKEKMSFAICKLSICSNSMPAYKYVHLHMHIFICTLHHFLLKPRYIEFVITLEAAILYTLHNLKATKPFT